MAFEMTTFQEYAEKHSLFSSIELAENWKFERSLLVNPQDLIKFWRRKRDLFLERLTLRTMK